MVNAWGRAWFGFKCGERGGVWGEHGGWGIVGGRRGGCRGGGYYIFGAPG